MGRKENDENRCALLTSTSVLMPGTRLTYHLQESDPRKSVEEAVYRDDSLIVARTESGERDAELPAIATRAEILDAVRPHPSRLMAVLGGVDRVRIDADGAEGDDRVAWESVDETSGGRQASEVRAGDVLGVLGRLADQGIEMAGSVRGDVEEASPAGVADIVGSVAFEEPERHQELLEELDVLERLDRIEKQLDRLLREFTEG